MHSLQPDCHVLEYSVNESLGYILSGIVASKPDVLGFSCYIWNIDYVRRLMCCVKLLLPDCVMVLGGPEVSFEEDFSNFPDAAYIVKGPGEVSFCKLIALLQNGERPSERIIEPCFEESFAALPSPLTREYFASFYQDKMLSASNQLLYYESTRGCPFSCAYCLSSTHERIESVPLEQVFSDIMGMIRHGAACIKFVDRTFNANSERANKILEFVRNLDTTCVFHFEVGADLLDAKTISILKDMPVHRVQFEAGIQSISPKVLDHVQRKMNVSAALNNIETLSGFGNCHIHADLIAGLPFETISSFAEAVNVCVRARPHTLQIGFLKLLRGSSLRRDSDKFGLVYTPFAPYEILETPHMTYDEMCRIKRVGEVVDKFYNSGFYARCLDVALSLVFVDDAFSLFEALATHCRNHGGFRVSLKRSYALMLSFLLLYVEKDLAHHLVKLDCLSHDPKGMLPDGIEQKRDKETEKSLRQEERYRHTPLRVEVFAFDNTTCVFDYSQKHPVTGEYLYEVKGTAN